MNAHTALRVRRSALVAVALAASLAMEIGGYLATAEADRPEASWVTLHTAVAVVFLVCAVVSWRLGVRPLVSALMIAFPFLWIPQTVYAVIGEIGWLWPLVHGADLSWAVLTGVLVLVYPRGELRGGFAWTIVGIALAATLVRFAAVLLISEPDPDNCPCVPNPYAVVALPGVFALIDIGYRLVGVVLVLVIAGQLLVRWVRGSVPARTVAFLMPLALIAWAVTLAAQAASYAVVSTTDTVLSTIALLAIITIPVSYVAGIAHARNMRSRVADLMRITRAGADRAVWEAALARSLRDESLAVFWWEESRGDYLDSEGNPVVASASARILPVVGANDTPIALISHDRVLTDNTRLLDGLSSALRLSIENGRLRSEVERTLAQVVESRQRIIEAGDSARRRIERDLHDGAQQQLVVLSMELRGLATRANAAGLPDLADDAEQAIRRLSDALAELRELARGIHPSLLSEGGLALAVPELAGRCPVPTELSVELPARLPEVVEATAYFVVGEGLANIARHSEAGRAWLRLTFGDGRLQIVIRDNGAGGAVLDGGSGLRGLADRVDAVGGTLDVVSARGEGTTLTVVLPA